MVYEIKSPNDILSYDSSTGTSPRKQQTYVKICKLASSKILTIVFLIPTNSHNVLNRPLYNIIYIGTFQYTCDCSIRVLCFIQSDFLKPSVLLMLTQNKLIAL